MNVFKCLYCNQYFELKPKGKAHAARQNGTGLLTVALLFNIFVILRVSTLIIPELGEFLVDSVDRYFGNLTGSSIGKILALIPLLLLYPIVRFTLGTQESYDRTIAAFEAQNPDIQKKISNKGRNYFFISLGLLLIPLLSFIF